MVDPFQHHCNQWVAQLEEVHEQVEKLSRELAAQTLRADGLSGQLTAARTRLGELVADLRALADKQDGVLEDESL